MTRSANWYRGYRATRNGPKPHGTNNAYVNYGCRCGLCVEAHRVENARQRATSNASLGGDAFEQFSTTPNEALPSDALALWKT